MPCKLQINPKEFIGVRVVGDRLTTGDGEESEYEFCNAFGEDDEVPAIPGKFSENSGEETAHWVETCDIEKDQGKEDGGVLDGRGEKKEKVQDEPPMVSTDQKWCGAGLFKGLPCW